jgi:hypothetical protein
MIASAFNTKMQKLTRELAPAGLDPTKKITIFKDNDDVYVIDSTVKNFNTTDNSQYILFGKIKKMSDAGVDMLDVWLSEVYYSWDGEVLNVGEGDLPKDEKGLIFWTITRNSTFHCNIHEILSSFSKEIIELIFLR